MAVLLAPQQLASGWFKRGSGLQRRISQINQDRARARGARAGSVAGGERFGSELYWLLCALSGFEAVASKRSQVVAFGQTRVSRIQKPGVGFLKSAIWRSQTPNGPKTAPWCSFRKAVPHAFLVPNRRGCDLVHPFLTRNCMRVASTRGLHTRRHRFLCSQFSYVLRCCGSAGVRKSTLFSVT